MTKSLWATLIVTPNCFSLRIVSHPNALGLVVLFWNKPALTLRCLASVKATNGSEAVKKVMLVDNGSLPEQRETVREWAMGNFSNVEILSLSCNRGFAGGMNAGLKRVFDDPQIESVVALSNDVELDKSFFEMMPETFYSSIFCPRVHHLQDKRKVAYRYGHCDLDRFDLRHISEPRVNEILFPFYYPAAGTIWGRGAYDKLNGFNEKFLCYWEDVELSYRAKEEGVSLVSLDDAILYHQGRATTGKNQRMLDSFKKGREIFKAIVVASGKRD